MVETDISYDNRRLVDVLAAVFGISAWLCVNGLFTQLPILVQTAPEAWNLPSYLSILIQIANVGPIGYTILSRLVGRHVVQDTVFIYVLLLLGTTAVLFMAFFYHETTTVFGVEHSTPLFVLTFCVAMVGCTSSVLFIPFMNNYPEIHLVSYLIGEGLSGFIPSAVSLIQGVGATKCVNSTTATGEREAHAEFLPPLFSSHLFFIVMFIIMCMSTVSFMLLNKLPACKLVRLRKKSVSETSPVTLEVADSSSLQSNKTPMYNVPTSTGRFLSPPLYTGLLVLTAAISMFANGALPSIQSYSCMPYGTQAYHLAVNLAHIANPTACFIAFFLPRTNLMLIWVFTIIVTISVTYNVIIALLSPSPPLQHQLLGQAIIVGSWVLSGGLISYVKLSIAALFRREGGQGLFWYGACTQMGAAVGSGISFYMVNVAKVLKSYNPCR